MSEKDLPIEVDARARLDLLRRVAALGYAVAAGAAIASTLLPDPNTGDHGALRGVAVLLAVASLVMVVGRRMPAPLLKALAITLPVLVTSFVVAVARPIGPMPLYYVYLALTCAYFCTRREAMVQLGIFYVALAVALTQAEPGQRSLTYVVVASIITIVAGVVDNVLQRERALRLALHEVASTDALTGLLNRRAFTAAFEREMHRARRSGLPLSLVLFDLDHFKLVNDRFGHAAGDAALQRFARILADEVRPGDIAARVGGEEFTVGLFDCDEEGARGWAQRVVDRLAAETETDEIRLTTSAGVAPADPARPTIDEVLLGADRALYAAKAAGRHRVVALGDPGVGPLAST